MEVPFCSSLSCCCRGACARPLASSILFFVSPQNPRIHTITSTTKDPTHGCRCHWTATYYIVELVTGSQSRPLLNHTLFVVHPSVPPPAVLDFISHLPENHGAYRHLLCYSDVLTLRTRRHPSASPRRILLAKTPERP